VTSVVGIVGHVNREVPEHFLI